MCGDDDAPRATAISVPCQHCGELARVWLTHEEARTYATMLLCAVDGIAPLGVIAPPFFDADRGQGS